MYSVYSNSPMSRVSYTAKPSLSSNTYIPTKLLSATQILQAAKFPRIMIIGFGKAGTKALFEYLKRHPQLAGPGKEMRFFSLHYKNGLHSYLKALPTPPPNGFIVEKSPDYILVPQVPERIIADASSLGLEASKLKFIVVLRNPIDRAISEYLEWDVQRKIKQQPLLPPFEAVLTKQTGETDFRVKFINTSCYAYHIQHWLKYFSPEQVCFVDGDQFIQQPYTVVHKLEACLNLLPYFKESNFILDRKRGFYCYKKDASKNKPLCMGMNKGRPHPSIKSQVYEKLVEYFRQWDQQLADVTGLQWSWFSSYPMNTTTTR